MCKLTLNTQTKLIKLENVCKAWKELQKSLNIGPLIMEEKSKIDKCRAYVFLEFGVINKNNYNSNSKNSLGFRNLLEKLENNFFNSCMKFKFLGGQIPLFE